VSVTNEDRWSGTSSDYTDVRRAPRFVAWSFVMRTEVIQAEGKRENQSNSTGVQMKIQAPRFVAWFVVLVLMIEWSKINGSGSTGGQMMALRFICMNAKDLSVMLRVQAKGKEAKFAHNLSILRPHDRRGEEEGKGYD